MDIRFKQQHSFLDIRNVEIGFNVTKAADASGNTTGIVNPSDLFLVKNIRYNNNDIKAKSGRRFENLFHNWRKYSIGKKSHKPRQSNDAPPVLAARNTAAGSRNSQYKDLS